ncbi:MAG: NOL1/NOP2/sun family putative RNA methylase [Candidatus Hydrothermales bacterium]
MFKNTSFYSYLVNLIGTKETKDFFESVREEFPKVLRVNQIKTDKNFIKERLKGKGFLLKENPVYENSFEVLYEPFELGKTLEHYAGLFYIQEKSSLLPAKILNPLENQLVLDIASAPGSKATQMGEMMKNKGVIVANDIHLPRIKALTHNIDRIGLINTAVTMIDGVKFGDYYFEIFDKVLVDAPCSSMGTVHKSKEVLSWWNEREVNYFKNIQKKLLISAVKSLKVGGELVYSTCTLTVEENEELIDEILKKFPLEVLRIDDLGIGEGRGFVYYKGKKFSKEIEKAVRIWPHRSFMEGFFIVKLKKVDRLKGEKKSFLKREYRKILKKKDYEISKFLKFLESYFGIDTSYFDDKIFKFSNDIWLLSEDFERFEVPHSFREGMRIARLHKDEYKLTTNSAQILFPLIRKNVYEIKNSSDALKVLKGSEIYLNKNEEDGYKILVYDSICLGVGVKRGSKLKSQIPKSRRFEEVVL